MNIIELAKSGYINPPSAREIEEASTATKNALSTLRNKYKYLIFVAGFAFLIGAAFTYRNYSPFEITEYDWLVKSVVIVMVGVCFAILALGIAIRFLANDLEKAAERLNAEDFFAPIQGERNLEAVITARNEVVAIADWCSSALSEKRELTNGEFKRFTELFFEHNRKKSEAIEAEKIAKLKSQLYSVQG